jgi:thioredoxin-like negative regulator of GroEL
MGAEYLGMLKHRALVLVLIAGSPVVADAAWAQAPSPAGASAAESGSGTGATVAAEDVGPTLARFTGPMPTAEQRAAMESTVQAALAQRPKDPALRFSQAMLERARGDRAAALERMQALVAEQSKVAEYQFWYGTLEFETISGMLEAGSKAGRGREAMQKTLELDPNHVWARVGLYRFYANAPWIAGGSSSKARTMCEELLKLPGGRGEFQGRMMLADLAAIDEEWEEMAKQFGLAERAGGEGASPLAAIVGHAAALLDRKEDAAAAQTVLRRAEGMDGPTETSLPLVRARVAIALKDHARAVEQLTLVIERNPGARTARFLLAESLEKTGRKAEAAAAYRDFAERFPKDDRASKAQAAAKRLSA